MSYFYCNTTTHHEKRGKEKEENEERERELSQDLLNITEDKLVPF